MKKLVSSIIVSLDGFVAGVNGELNMFKVDEEFFDLSNMLTQAADTALYGKGTYNIMQSYWPTAADSPNASKHDKEHSAWYNKVPKFVLSKTLTSKEAPGATIISTNVTEEVARLKKGEGKAIQIFGSPGVVRSLTQAHLIDEYWIFLYPVIIGEGLPLFTGKTQPQELNLLSCKKLNSGAVALHYERMKK